MKIWVSSSCWQLKHFLCSPRKLGEMIWNDPIWRTYFSTGVETHQLVVVHCQTNQRNEALPSVYFWDYSRGVAWVVVSQISWNRLSHPQQLRVKWFPLLRCICLFSIFGRKKICSRLDRYCWWKKSCTTWDAQHPVNNGINYQPQLNWLAGFQPSTVSLFLVLVPTIVVVRTYLDNQLVLGREKAGPIYFYACLFS